MLSKSGILCLTLFFSCVSSALAQAPARSGFEINWTDEFNSPGLDTSKWTAADTNITTNNSLQDYLPSQVDVNNGDLVITSENIPSRDRPYRSGLVTSTALQKYGRWDVRAKLPTSKGMWPAIWLLADAPWPSEGEIDIMENRGDEPTMTSSAFHYGENPPVIHNYVSKNHSAVHDGQLQNYHDSYHTYSVEWDPNQVRFYVDDVHHWTVRDSDVDGFLSTDVGEMRLIINTAIGGNFLDNPDSSTQWPQEFRVDYVHAYSRTGTPVLTFENGDFELNQGSLAEWTTFGNSILNVQTGNDHVNSGDEALKLYGQFNGEENFSGIEQGLSVNEGEQLYASVDALVDSLDSLEGTNNEVLLKIDYYNQQYGLFGSDEYISSDSILLADGSTSTDAWINSELWSTAPEGAIEARVAIVFIQRDDASGAIFIDNIQFSSVPEPATATFLLALGCLATCHRRRRNG